MSESTKVTKSQKARSFMGVRRNFSRGGRPHFVDHFQIADDQCSLQDIGTEQIYVLVSMLILGLSKWSFQ